MRKGELVFWSVFVVVCGVATFGATNCDHHSTPESYLALVEKHMSIPEPIDLIVWQADYHSFYSQRDGHKSFLPKTVTIHYAAGHWKLVLNEDWWKDASYHARILALSHEVCHAAYDHDLIMPNLWWDISDDEKEFRQERARDCANDVFRRIQREG